MADSSTLWNMAKRQHDHMLAYKFAYEQLCKETGVTPQSPSEVYAGWDAQKKSVSQKINAMPQKD